jgi:DNA ligase-4
MIKEEHQDEDLPLLPVHAAAEQKPTAPLPTKALDHLMPFGVLCRRFEEIANMPEKSQRVGVLERLWQSLAGTDFFPFMRLILPQLDSQRATYGLRESKIARYYIDLLGLSHSSPDAERFKHWKDPSKNSTDATHFSDVVYVVLCKRAYVSSESLTVSEVNHHLDRLAAVTEVEEKKSTLMTLLRATSAMEQKWLIRIITKEMKMGLQHGSILAAFHPSALELYNNTNDLQYVCRKCTDPKELEVAGDVKTGIFLMQPLKPMLASVVDSAKLAILLRDEKLMVEPKYDGERMMLHISPDKIMYWTRNARNYTSQYGPKFDTIVRSQVKNVTTCILDGEFLLYDGNAQRFREFGHNRTFAASGLEFGDIDLVKQWFCYCIFDIVFLNGESLVQLPLNRRREMLKSIIDPKPTMLEVVPHTPAANVKSILTALDDSLRKGFEGVVVKIASSHYIPGERKMKWLKLKPDHIAGMADTVDLIILGGYYGVKFGQRHISHFLLGSWKDCPGQTPRDANATFLTVCKVGTGYNEADLRELNDKLQSHWLTMPKVPPWLNGWIPAKDDLPDQWIHPSDSVVMEVFGYSFNETTKFAIGHTIRFPRCHRFRYDKDIEDATDVTQLRVIIEQSKTFSRKTETLDELVMVRKTKQDVRKQQQREMQPRRTFACASDSILCVDPGSIIKSSSMFAGFEVCVLHASPDIISRRDLETLVLQGGGHVSANPTPLTSVIVSTGHDNVKVRNWKLEAQRNQDAMQLRYATIDIVSHEWLLESVAEEKVLPFAPRHMIFTSPSLQLKFAYALDEFDDAYFESATLESLRKSIAKAQMRCTVPSTVTDAEIVALHAKLHQ